MLRAIDVVPKARRTGDVLDTVLLDFDRRHRRRLSMTGTAGTAFLLDLPRPVPLADGDGLVLEDGRVIAVAAAAEAVMDIRCSDQAALVRVAWHLGNRHLPTELRGDCLRIREDHVIAAMVEGLGANVARLTAPFHPEGGAYEGGGGHRHQHHHDHDHDHD